jgi:hypothetical protein
MANRIMTVSSLAIAAMLLLAPGSTTRAETEMAERLTNRQIDSCVAEIGKRADYAEAHRVVHLVDRLDQKNLVELEVGITTNVYVGDDEAAARVYRTRCTTDTLADVIKLRVHRSAAAANQRG